MKGTERNPWSLQFETEEEALDFCAFMFGFKNWEDLSSKPDEVKKIVEAWYDNDRYRDESHTDTSETDY